MEILTALIFHPMFTPSGLNIVTDNMGTWLDRFYEPWLLSACPIANWMLLVKKYAATFSRSVLVSDPIEGWF